VAKEWGVAMELTVWVWLRNGYGIDCVGMAEWLGLTVGVAKEWTWLWD
jgi:hypothetical protein